MEVRFPIFVFALLLLMGRCRCLFGRKWGLRNTRRRTRGGLRARKSRRTMPGIIVRIVLVTLPVLILLFRVKSLVLRRVTILLVIVLVRVTRREVRRNEVVPFVAVYYVDDCFVYWYYSCGYEPVVASSWRASHGYYRG